VNRLYVDAAPLSETIGILDAILHELYT